MEEDNVCRKCVLWVSNDGKEGFCLSRDLFTNTRCSQCPDRIEGEYMKEEEWECFQYGEKM